MSAETPERRREAPRDRILGTARRLFYAEGVHTVGIDRIIAEAGVAKATFYHHFPSKDELVRTYVANESLRQRGLIAELPVDAPRDTLLTAFELMCRIGAEPTYRGCPFVNTAAEYPDPDHPVRRAIEDHRRWVRAWFRDMLAAEDHRDPERTADILLVLRDGLVVGFDLDDPRTVHAAVAEAVTRVLVPQEDENRRRVNG